MLREFIPPQERRKRRLRLLVILLALVTVIACAVSVWAVVSMRRLAKMPEIPAATLAPVQNPASAPVLTPVPATAPPQLTDRISLPQFAWIYLDADTTRQTQTFRNPAQNNALLQVSIVMDGERLWESDLLKPGETSKPVELSHPLGAGEYQARLIYHCYTNDGAGSPLNGADSSISLKVS